MADLPKWPLYCLFPSLPFNLAFITPHRSQPAREDAVKLLQLYLNFNHPVALAFIKQLIFAAIYLLYDIVFISFNTKV